RSRQGLAPPRPGARVRLSSGTWLLAVDGLLTDLECEQHLRKEDAHRLREVVGRELGDAGAWLVHALDPLAGRGDGGRAPLEAEGVGSLHPVRLAAAELAQRLGDPLADALPDLL